MIPRPNRACLRRPTVEIKSETDGQTAPEAAATALILKRVEELERVGQAGIAGSAVAELLTKAEEPTTAKGPEALEPWPMTLQTAITIGLDNSEIIRVISFGSGLSDRLLLRAKFAERCIPRAGRQWWPRPDCDRAAQRRCEPLAVQE